MSNTLPRLRLNLDFMPSPVEERPGFLIRDPYQFSEVTLLSPPRCCRPSRVFDGEQSDLDLRQELVRATGDLEVSELEAHLMETLRDAVPRRRQL